MSGDRATIVHVLELPECPDKIKIRVTQRVIRNTVTSVDELYQMDVRVHPSDNLKNIREKLATAENLGGWPLPTTGYTLRHHPLTSNDADNVDGVEVIEGGRRTFQKLGIKDGDAIEVVPRPSCFKVSIGGIGVDGISVKIRSSDKVVTLREVLQRRHSESLPTHYKFSFGEVLLDDEMPFRLYGLRKGDHIRATEVSAPPGLPGNGREVGTGRQS